MNISGIDKPDNKYQKIIKTCRQAVL